MVDYVPKIIYLFWFICLSFSLHENALPFTLTLMSLPDAKNQLSVLIISLSLSLSFLVTLFCLFSCSWVWQIKLEILFFYPVVNKTRDELSNVATTLSTLSLYGSWLAANLTEIVNDVKNVCTDSAGGGQAGCGNFQDNKYRVSANFSNVRAHLPFFGGLLWVFSLWCFA